MAKDLVIVESPAKARTVGRFLGGKYTAMASMGHVRDLPKREVGVAVENGFKPKYSVLPDKRKVVAEVKKASAAADTVYLATDPDREGEAIAWHLIEAAKIAKSKVKRVVFHEITAPAVRDAFDHPRTIDERLIDAQQARRVLDRLVGYDLSPVLWKKVRRGLSAGRVQSVALRLIVDREQEIQAFVSEEYWTIEALLSKADDGAEPVSFKADLRAIKGKRGKVAIPNGEEAARLTSDLEPAGFTVAKVATRERKGRPAPPFITSSLQQEAFRKLRFSTRRTMALAQQLYEGVDIGSEGSVGLITYMRTDSTNVAMTAVHETRDYIRDKFGPDYAPEKPRFYTKRVKGAQEAHEAIRPTSVRREPGSLRGNLTSDQFRLYDLIWQRMVASQMSDALLDGTTVDIEAAGTSSGTVYDFRATGSVLKFPGFRRLYLEGRDDVAKDKDADTPLPVLEKDDVLDSRGVTPTQHFTQPPPRYTEASLVRALEEQGIGRPSTYAPTVATVLARDYARQAKGRLTPTKLGIAVSGLLTQHFPDIMDVGFTARVEDKLDEIASGEREWTPVLKDFYGPFSESVELALKKAERVPRDQIDEDADEECDKCGKPMVIKSGRFGRFMACTGFPDCRYTRPADSPEERAVKELVSEDVDELCDKCEKRMVVKDSQRGRFLSCTSYPECQGVAPLRVGVECEKCGSDMIERKQRKRDGRTFYGCIDYPECTHTLNPLPQPCPDCGKLLVADGRNRRNARCLEDECGFTGRPPRFDAQPEEVVEMAS